MNALLLTLFVSFILVVLGLLAFGFAFRQRDHDHIDRLANLPLDDGWDPTVNRVPPFPSTRSASPSPPGVPSGEPHVRN